VSPAYAACWIDSQAACSVTSRAADDREVDVEAALAEQEALLAELDGLGGADGYVFEEVAECLLALGRAEDARTFFGRAYASLAGDVHLRTDEPERLERLKSLGGV
jgi:hypothetical protein